MGTPKWTQKVLKGLQVGKMNVPMARLENKPLTKSISLFF
jgi:hypothetical protein